MSDVVDGESCSFAECGGTSVDAVLMTEDLKHAFSDGTGADKLTLLLDRILHCPLKAVVQYVYSELSGSVAAVDDDHRTLLTDKRIENDFVETRHKISSSDETNNTFSTMSDPPLNDRRQPCLIHGSDSMKFDEKSHSENVCSTSPPPVKRPKIDLDRAAKFNFRSTFTTTDGESSMINHHNIAGTDDNDNGKNDDCDGNDADVKSKPTDVSCACQAMMSSSIGGSVRRVFCKDCYQQTRLKSPSDDFSKLLLLCYSLLCQKAAQQVQ